MIYLECQERKNPLYNCVIRLNATPCVLRRPLFMLMRSRSIMHAFQDSVRRYVARATFETLGLRRDFLRVETRIVARYNSIFFSSKGWYSNFYMLEQTHSLPTQGSIQLHIPLVRLLSSDSDSHIQQHGNRRDRTFLTTTTYPAQRYTQSMGRICLHHDFPRNLHLHCASSLALALEIQELWIG